MNSSRKILADIAQGKLKACTSILTWDEVVHILIKRMGREKASYYGERLLKFKELVFICPDMNIMNKANEYINKYKLDPRDAIHVTTALSCNINEIISDDRDFDIISEIKRIGFE